MHTLSVVFVDAGGGSRIVRLNITDTAIATDGLAALLAGSNADWSEYWVGETQQQTPVPTNAVYVSAKSIAHLYYSDGTDLAHVRIPAPVEALFMADGETVDPTDPTGVLAALGAILTADDGDAAPTFVSGFRGS